MKFSESISIKINQLNGIDNHLVVEFSDGSKTFIPINEDNADYQEYLAWLAEGNTPLPADE